MIDRVTELPRDIKMFCHETIAAASVNGGGSEKD
jgi:hypothetical protein